MKLKYPVPIKIGKDMTIHSNADNVTCLDFGYRELSEITIDLKSFNMYQKNQGGEVARDIDHFWEIDAEQIGGFDSEKWQREMERKAGASKKHLTAFPKFVESRHCGSYVGITSAHELHVIVHYGIHYTAVIAQIDRTKDYARLHLVHAIKEFNKTIREFISSVKKTLLELYPPSKQVKWHVTPQSVFQKTDDLYNATGSYTPLKVFREEGIIPIYYQYEERDALDALNSRFMTPGPNGEEMVTVSPFNQFLKRCLNGGYSRALNNSRGVSVPTENYQDDKFNSYTAWCICAIAYYLYIIPNGQGLKVKKTKVPKLPI